MCTCLKQESLRGSCDIAAGQSSPLVEEGENIFREDEKLPSCRLHLIFADAHVDKLSDDIYQPDALLSPQSFGLTERRFNTQKAVCQYLWAIKEPAGGCAIKYHVNKDIRLPVRKHTHKHNPVHVGELKKDRNTEEGEKIGVSGRSNT